MLRRAAILALLLPLIALPRSASPGLEAAGAEFSEVWSTQAHIPLDDFTVRLLDGNVFVRTRTALRIHDSATGAERWRYAPAGASVREWSPAGSTVIVKTLRPSPSGDVIALTGISRETGTVLWHRKGLDLGGPMSISTGAEVIPPVGLAWNADSRSLLGVTPETGQTRWTFQLPPSCGRIHTASSDARATAIVALCQKDIRVIVLDPEHGMERWSTALTSFSGLHVQEGVVIVYRPENLLVHDAVTGRVIVEREGCTNDCAVVHVGGRIMVTHAQDGTSTVEGIDPADGSVAWRRVQRNGPRYGWLAGVQATVYAMPSGDALGRVLDVIQPSTGELRRIPIPTTGRLFGADGDRLYVFQTVRSAAGPSRLRVTALRVPDWLGGAAPAAEPVATPGADLCDLLRAAGFTVLDRAPDLGRASPPFTTCEFGEVGKEPMSAEFWRLPTEAGAARVLAELGADGESDPVSGVGDEALTVGLHGRAIIVRAGRDLVRIRSPYLEAGNRLLPVARAVTERLGSLRWAVPTSWSLATPHDGPSSGRTIRLPGTRFQIRDDPEAPIMLSAYNADERSPTYLRDGAGFIRGRERMKAISPDGRWAAGDFKDYIDGRDGVVLLDRRSGKIRRIFTVKPPLLNNTPVWSSDGRLLLTLWRDNDDDHVSIGFVIVDPERGTFTITSTEKDDEIYEHPYLWSADEFGVSTRFGIGDYASYEGDDEEVYDSYALRAFDADGTALSTWPRQSRPDSAILDPYSPSRRRLVGWCADRPRDLCVHDTATGAPLAQIEADLRYPIRWYDEDHLLVWRRYGAGYAASVMDLYGVISTDLAWSSATGQEGVKLFYVPRRR
ncbi:PQQ-binding-like beta-propeller repeat protein [Streptosporangium sp. NPDC000095]|uniref:outer membrane protein assembly factor BamB family protein n=1 Tax=Streptosporangium sp. NPDC000095 TaxID=3366184 RepID=UPI0036C9FC02